MKRPVLAQTAALDSDQKSRSPDVGRPSAVGGTALAGIRPTLGDRQNRGRLLTRGDWAHRIRALPDAPLSAERLPPLHELAGGNFFRGLALIDLVEAMLKRAFGDSAVAVRVNAAGQGGYFQLHVDTRCVAVDTVRQFFRRAVYRRFGLHPEPEFIQPHPGGAAVGVRLDRFDRLPDLIRALE